jgi:hypothetical protein
MHFVIEGEPMHFFIGESIDMICYWGSLADGDKNMYTSALFLYNAHNAHECENSIVL